MENRNLVIRLLDYVENVGNRLPAPATLFFIMSLLIIILSAICAYFGIAVSYNFIDPVTHLPVQREVVAVSLLSPDGIRFIVTSIIDNFTSFYALGTIFTIMIGVSLADGTGFLSTLLRSVAHKTPSVLLTPTVLFIGIMSNLASSVGYVIFVPLAAMLFLSFNRHPIAGLVTAFAGVSGGWAANLLIGTNDPIFADISTQSANLLNPNYEVLPTANWYFMIASTILIVIIGTFITSKIVEPRLGTYLGKNIEPIKGISATEKKSLLYALLSLLIYSCLVMIILLPESSILRGEGGSIIRSPFMDGIIFFMMFAFLIPGFVYGVCNKSIKNDKDVLKFMKKTISDLSGFFILLFFAAQFVAYFNYSNLGVILSVKGSALLSDIGFTGLYLIVSFVLLTAFINLFIAVDLAKWAMMAPIFIPMFMRMGISPELTQLAYRIGDSSTNIISPLMPFFPLIAAYCQKYDTEGGFGTLISNMLPYTISILVGWVLLLIVWYLLGLPIGPASPLHY